MVSFLLSVNPAITHVVYEYLSIRLRTALNVTSISIWQGFWIGFAAKALGTTITYPFILIKKRMQGQGGKPQGAVQIIKEIYFAHGVAQYTDDTLTDYHTYFQLTGLFASMHLHILKTGISSAVSFGSSFLLYKFLFCKETGLHVVELNKCCILCRKMLDL